MGHDAKRRRLTTEETTSSELTPLPGDEELTPAELAIMEALAKDTHDSIRAASEPANSADDRQHGPIQADPTQPEETKASDTATEAHAESSKAETLPPVAPGFAMKTPRKNAKEAKPQPHLLIDLSKSEEIKVKKHTVYQMRNGQCYMIVHEATGQAEADILWAEVTDLKLHLRRRIPFALFEHPFSEAEMNTVTMEGTQVMLPWLVQQSHNLRVRAMKETDQIIKPNKLKYCLRQISEKASQWENLIAHHPEQAI